MSYFFDRSDARVPNASRRRALAPSVSVTVQNLYARFIRRLIGEVHKKILVQFPDEVLADVAAREDTVLPTRIAIKLDILEVDISQLLDEQDLMLRGELDKIASKVARHNKNQLVRVIPLSISDRGLQPMFDKFFDHNIDLIKSLQGEQLRNARALIETAQQSGLRVEALSKQLQHTLGVGRSRANLIARDQTLKLNANLTKQRSINAGSVEYTWTTSNDDNVREEHEALEGITQRWDNPPGVGHPGEDYQCRCTAYPRFPFLD